MSSPVLRRRRRRVLQLAAAGAVALVVAASSGGPAQASGVVPEPINGTGSTWSANAIERWISNVRANGITVNYAAQGSSAGRSSFKSGLDDFGVSEIPYGVTPGDDPPTRTFAYMPIVAGGTALQYQIQVGGQKVTDLRLSSETVTLIFTGQITNWNDARITADYGRALPDKPIIPIIRSDGSGTSAQFTAFMASQHPSIWNPFCERYLGGGFCRFTSNYPQFPGSKAQAGSDGVSNFVHASYGDGAIGYVEYSYALEKNDPVVKLLNSADYYVLPTASNVAVALTAATFNADRTQDLSGVYTNPDPRAYPMSSYSYALVPTGTPESGGIRPGEGLTLSRFANYFLCQGQSYVANIGYSPLPRVLVEEGLAVVRQIPNAETASISIENCENPTFQGGRNVLLESAPQPAECDRRGAAPCSSGGAAPAGGTGGAAGSAGGAAGGTASGQPGTSGSAGGADAAGAGAAAAEGSSAVVGDGDTTTGVDPATGLPLDATASGDGVTDVVGTTAQVSALREAGGLQWALYAVCALSLLVVVLGPPLLSRRLRDGPRTDRPG